MLTKTLLATLLHRKDRAQEKYVDILQRPMTIQGATKAVSNWLPFLLKTDRDALSMDREAYAAINLPVSLIWGSEDSITPIDQARDLQSIIDGSSLYVLPDVGHIPQLENPAGFQQALSDQIRKMAGY